MWLCARRSRAAGVLFGLPGAAWARGASTRQEPLARGPWGLVTFSGLVGPRLGGGGVAWGVGGGGEPLVLEARPDFARDRALALVCWCGTLGGGKR